MALAPAQCRRGRAQCSQGRSPRRMPRRSPARSLKCRTSHNSNSARGVLHSLARFAASYWLRLSQLSPSETYPRSAAPIVNAPLPHPTSSRRSPLAVAGRRRLSQSHRSNNKVSPWIRVAGKPSKVTSTDLSIKPLSLRGQGSTRHVTGQAPRTRRLALLSRLMAAGALNLTQGSDLPSLPNKRSLRFGW